MVPTLKIDYMLDSPSSNLALIASGEKERKISRKINGLVVFAKIIHYRVAHYRKGKKIMILIEN